MPAAMRLTELWLELTAQKVNPQKSLAIQVLQPRSTAQICGYVCQCRRVEFLRRCGVACPALQCAETATGHAVPTLLRAKRSQEAIGRSPSIACHTQQTPQTAQPLLKWHAIDTNLALDLRAPLFPPPPLWETDA